MLKRTVDLVVNGLVYTYFRLFFRFRYLGFPVVFNSGVELENTGTLSIENHSNIGKDTWIRSATLGKGVGISFGKNSMIGRRNFISCEREIVVGNNCIFGPNVTVVDSNHAYSDISKPILVQGTTEPLPVSISDDCWIGINAVILPGSKIGKHCVIGANSVVSGSIPDYSVVVGNPARIVKRYNSKSDKWMKKSK